MQNFISLDDIKDPLTPCKSSSEITQRSFNSISNAVNSCGVLQCFGFAALLMLPAGPRRARRVARAAASVMVCYN